jgi:hypothetical protein
MSLDFYPCQLEETFVLSPSTGPLHQITNMLACSRDVIQKYGYGTGSSINEIWFREKITFFDCSPLVTVLKFSNKTIRRGPGLRTFSPARELDSRASMPRESFPFRVCRGCSPWFEPSSSASLRGKTSCQLFLSGGEDRPFRNWSEGRFMIS